jgi:NAD(P)-dependent dehydrogenase (short-subunit alcohol dehydrogenase family)
MKIEGAAALVTGANRGLGAAIAQALLDSGAKVYGAARDSTTITNRTDAGHGGIFQHHRDFVATTLEFLDR